MKTNKRPHDGFGDDRKNVVTFSSKFSSRDIKLFEINEELQRYLTTGKTLHILGDETVNGNAVLCTSSQTYTIKKVETSNSTFISTLQSNYDILCKVNCHYEITPTLPKLEEIKSILSSSVYQGCNYDHDHPPHKECLFTFDDLHNRILASENELRNAIAEMHTKEIDGFIRLLDRRTLYNSFMCIVDSIIERKFDNELIPMSMFQDVRNQFSHVDPIFLDYCLSRFGVIDQSIWKLNVDKAAQAVAHSLFLERIFLNHNNDLWNRDDFLATWSSRVPCISCPSESLLAGIALVEDSGKGSSYRYLPLEDMPLDSKQRFKYLFEVRPKYKLEEISVYVSDLVGRSGQPKSIPALLMDFTRFIDGYYFLKLT